MYETFINPWVRKPLIWTRILKKKIEFNFWEEIHLFELGNQRKIWKSNLRGVRCEMHPTARLSLSISLSSLSVSFSITHTLHLYIYRQNAVLLVFTSLICVYFCDLTNRICFQFPRKWSGLILYVHVTSQRDERVDRPVLKMTMKAHKIVANVWWLVYDKCQSFWFYPWN